MQQSEEDSREVLLSLFVTVFVLLSVSVTVLVLLSSSFTVLVLDVNSL